jgi:3-oxoacyl-[acyl-carrier protein] reductase
MSVPIDLADKTALVTGSSRGIGAAIARTLHAAGATVILNYVADPAGQNLADATAVTNDLGGAPIIECDISQPPRVAAMFAQVAKDHGHLDLLVNNAGIIRDRSIRKMTADEFDSVIRVNLAGTFNCIQAAQPLLRPGGRVVNLASVSAALGFFGQANYSASKAGVIALTKVAARELAKQQVTVNAVAPGFVDTDMTRTMPPDVTKAFLEQVPLGRMGTTEDIAGAVLFLCSPLALYVTGQTLHVNGGFHMP